MLVVGLWVRDGGAAAILRGGTAMWTSLSQITGLAASGAGLAGLYLVARPKALEQRYGIDRLFVWHRILGESMALLIAAHIATSLVAWQADLGWWSAFRELTGRAPDTGTATVGVLLIAIITLSSLRSIRRRMAYETWYILHLTAYAGFALSFFHQLSSARRTTARSARRRAPGVDGLRFTVKARRDASAAITRLRPGTKVVVEGPYGAHTPDGLNGTKTLLIAGGVGIAPIRSLLERLSEDAEPIVLIRARHAGELVHLDEIRALASRSNGRVHVLVGPTAKLAGHDPFAAEHLRRLAPDIQERHALLCGPERLLHAARAGVRSAGVPAAHIHYERPWW